MAICTLKKFKQNKWGEICEVIENSLTPKLTDMGIFPGKKVKILFRAPLGDPLAIEIDGYTLSLRLDEANLISVKDLQAEVL